ncbi:biotin-dependent carboxyltransferase family protein [Virgisporangium aurantiacum]|uniref:Allophanate hydrolase n=1 Tax=Virgisporangium aurantiacum TaxID=175570 RepID=A0A8J3YXN1_9ACTN|nr:biotin-dependent carboxyltransferase family protein [Virgisporangium aurantiacum]GIJ52577.1 allophanate hydrolase [Virgisporangium aurantiacum]
MITVLRAGALTTVQDQGRAGHAHLGVPTAGALDGPALRLANRLVGNDRAAAGLEITVSGCRLRVHRTTIVAVTGAPTTKITVDARSVDAGVPVPVPAGAVLDIGPATAGVRTYLAVAGGIDVPPVLGSRSTDTLSGLGPAPLRDGDTLRVGAPTGPAAPVWFTPAADREPRLRVALGPRDDWFTADAIGTLTTATWTVSTRSNRVAARLEGPKLTRANPDELPSEGIVLGAVQVPAGGEPLVFLADHPTTGGYPVIGVVHPDDLPLLAQCRPGATITFTQGKPWT